VYFLSKGVRLREPIENSLVTRLRAAMENNNQTEIWSIFKEVSTLPTEIKDSVLQEMLLAKDKNSDLNVLMLAVRFGSPATVDCILEAVQTLPQAHRALVLKDMLVVAKDQPLNNALMLAARHDAASVDLILKAVQTLPEEDRGLALTEMLFAKDLYDDSNALMLASRYNGRSVDSILKAVQTSLREDDRYIVLKKILLQRGRSPYRHIGYNHNALMFAVQYNVPAMGPILEAVQTLPEAHGASVLKDMLLEKDQHTENNALMLAAKGSNPDAVDSILKVLQNLPEGHRGLVSKEILLQKGHLRSFDWEGGYSALMLAVQYNEAAVDLILKALEALLGENKDSVLEEMLLAKDNAYERNALMLAMEGNKRAAVGSIIQAAGTLPANPERSVLKHMLLEKDNNGNNAFMLARRHNLFAVLFCILELEAFQALQDEDKGLVLKELLLAKNSCNQNDALILVLKNNSPAAVDSMLKAVQTLAAEFKHSFLKGMLVERFLKGMLVEKCKDDGCNALMLAAKHNPTAVDLILKVVKTLPEEGKLSVLVEMLLAKDNKGCNALILAKQGNSLSFIAEGLESISSVAEILKSGRLFYEVLSLLPDEYEEKHHLLSLRQFIKPHLLASREQKNYVREWFLAKDTSREEKASLFKLKPMQVMNLILRGLKPEELKIKIVELLSLLLSSEPTDELRSDTTSSSDQGDNSVERKIASMSEQLVSDRAVSPDTKKAAECVINYAKRIRGAASAGLFSPATEISGGIEMQSFQPGGGSK
jgi:hypothetical protein